MTSRHSGDSFVDTFMPEILTRDNRNGILSVSTAPIHDSGKSVGFIVKFHTLQPCASENEPQESASPLTGGKTAVKAGASAAKSDDAPMRDALKWPGIPSTYPSDIMRASAPPTDEEIETSTTGCENIEPWLAQLDKCHRDSQLAKKTLSDLRAGKSVGLTIDLKLGTITPRPAHSDEIEWLYRSRQVVISEGMHSGEELAKNVGAGTVTMLILHQQKPDFTYH